MFPHLNVVVQVTLNMRCSATYDFNPKHQPAYSKDVQTSDHQDNLELLVERCVQLRQDTSSSSLLHQPVAWQKRVAFCLQYNGLLPPA